MDATLRSDTQPPADTSIDIEAVRYDSSDGEDSYFYAVTWCIRRASAWVEGPVATDLCAQLAATSALLNEGLSIADIRRLRHGMRTAVAWDYSASVTSLVHVLTFDGTPGIYPLGDSATCAPFPRWVQSALKRAVEAHLEEVGGVQEVAA